MLSPAVRLTWLALWPSLRATLTAPTAVSIIATRRGGACRSHRAATGGAAAASEESNRSSVATAGRQCQVQRPAIRGGGRRRAREPLAQKVAMRRVTRRLYPPLMRWRPRLLECSGGRLRLLRLRYPQLFPWMPHSQKLRLLTPHLTIVYSFSTSGAGGRATFGANAAPPHLSIVALSRNVVKAPIATSAKACLLLMHRSPSPLRPTSQRVSTI